MQDRYPMGGPAHGAGEAQASRQSLALLRFPILIGVTGKRFLDKTNAAADMRAADALSDRLRILFRALDQNFPETPKILLTGAAFGTDLVAAEAALDMGPRWGVAAVLPFDRALFEEDFRPTPQEEAEGWTDLYARHAEALSRLLDLAAEPNPRVLIRELPKLAAPDGSEATVAMLERDQPKRDKALRHNHYEQVGQLIAEMSTIMIAVMGSGERAETEEANGGTARVVACRRAGRPDKVGAMVAARSRVLRHEWSDLAGPPAGSTWLVDLDREDWVGPFPVRVLPPLLDRPYEDVYLGYPGKDMPDELPAYVGPVGRLITALHRNAGGLGLAGPEEYAEQRLLRASLVLANGFERFHRGLPGGVGSGACANAPNLAPVRDLAGALESARHVLSARQRRAKTVSTWSFRVLAIFFVLAVFAFETFAKFFPGDPRALAVYLAFLIGIGVVAIVARAMLWQPASEDYRAVSEMLRVQRAWWSAGLSARVDREHLQGVDHDLASVREGAKTIIAWICLRCHDATPRMLDWAHVRGTSATAREMHPESPAPEDWIGNQFWYFTRNAERRESKVQRGEASSWLLFVTSVALGGVLCVWLTWPVTRTWFQQAAMLGAPNCPKPGAGAVMPVIWLVPALFALYFRVLNRDIRHGPGAVILNSGLSVIAAVALALTITSAVLLFTPCAEVNHYAEKVNHYTDYVTMIVLVVFSASAGAIRFLSEKLGYEAEALEYRDARRRFQYAERLLAAGSDPATDAPADAEEARRIVLELGRLALAENEAWLKSRRERPLAPVV